MKLKIARWYVALAVLVPGFDDPLCVGFGLRGSEDKARDAAFMMAAELAAS